jgi:GntR family transcriptional regulator, transcriptional repressor for pyruvate dehydrogenase complex
MGIDGSAGETVVTTEQAVTNAAERIATELRLEIISQFADGEHLGSAEELAERFEVSVPTLRQALRVLEAEGLVWVRRGNSGGYFASTPSVEVVSRSASALLQRQGTQLRDLLTCLQLIGPEVVALAAASPDIAGREALADYIEENWAGRDHTEVGVAVEVTLALGSRLSALCANPALGLFSAVLTDLVRDLQAQAVATVSPDLIVEITKRTAAGHLMLARGIRDGDIPTARQAVHLINTNLVL